MSLLAFSDAISVCAGRSTIEKWHGLVHLLGSFGFRCLACVDFSLMLFFVDERWKTGEGCWWLRPWDSSSNWKMHSSSVSSRKRGDDAAFADDKRCDPASVSHSSDGSKSHIVLAYPFSASAPTGVTYDQQVYWKQ